MGIKHISFNSERLHVPVSASKIRSDLFSYWQYLPDAVKSSMAIKVVILGTESTGKTVLTQRLARHYNATPVFEAGRDIIPHSNHFSIDDLYTTAQAHARRIRSAETGASPLIIIDTDIHITMSYCRFAFNKELIVDQPVYDANKASLYLYLTKDIDYIQDGTRLSEADRNKLDVSHREVLKESNIPFTEISGSWEERFEKAVNKINQLIGYGLRRDVFQDV